jgi:hypothetical protein
MSDPLLDYSSDELASWDPRMLADYLLFNCREVDRLRRHVDAAFGHASSGDAHAARVELTQARWGTPSVAETWRR